MPAPHPPGSAPDGSAAPAACAGSTLRVATSLLGPSIPGHWHDVRACELLLCRSAQVESAMPAARRRHGMLYLPKLIRRWTTGANSSSLAAHACMCWPHLSTSRQVLLHRHLEVRCSMHFIPINRHLSSSNKELDMHTHVTPAGPCPPSNAPDQCRTHGAAHVCHIRREERRRQHYSYGA